MAVSLGEINFGLGPDTSRLQKAMNLVRQFGTTVSNAAKSQVEGSKAVEAQLRRQEAATLSALQRYLSLSDKIREAGGDPKLLTATTKAFNALTKEMTSGRLSALQYQRTQENFSASMFRVQRELGGVTTGLRAQAAQQKAAAAATKANEQAQITLERRLATAQAKIDSYNAALQRLGQGYRSQVAFDPSAALSKLQGTLQTPGISRLDASRAINEFNASVGTAQRSVATFSRTQKDVATSMNQADAALMKQERQFFEAQRAVQRYQAQLEQLSATHREWMASLFNPGAALNNLQSTLQNPATTGVAAQRAMQSFKNELASASTEAKRLASTGLEGFLQRVAQNVVLIAGPLSGVGFRLALFANMVESVGLKAAAMIAGVGGGVFALERLGEAAVKTAMKMQQVELTLTAVNGSAILAQHDIDFLRGVADRAGASFTVLAQAFGRLEAASKGTSLEGDKTRRIFEQMVLVNQKLGGSSSDLEGVLMAIEQIMSKGQVMAQELHLQLGNRMPGAMQRFAEGLGVSTAELNKMMQQGQLTVSVLSKFADAAAKGVHVNIGDVINTITASFERFNNAVTFFLDKLDRTVGISQAVVNSLNGITAALKFLTANMSNTISVIGAIGGGLAGIFAPIIINGVIALGRAIVVTTGAMIGFNAAILANPIGGVITLLVRLGLVAASAAVGYELMNSVIGKTSETTDDAIKHAEDYAKAQQNAHYLVTQATQDEITQLERRSKAIEDAIVKQKALIASSNARPETTPGITSFIPNPFASVSTDGLKAAETELSKLESQSTRAKAALAALREVLKQQQQDIANQGDKQILSQNTLNAIQKAKDQIEDLRQKLLYLQMPPGFGREQVKIMEEINKKVAAFKLGLERAKVPAAQLNDLLKQFEQILTSETQAQFADRLRKAYDDVNRRIAAANEETRELGLNPGARQYAQSIARINNEIARIVQQMRELGAPEAKIKALSDALRKAETTAANAQFREKLAIPLKEAEQQITLTNQKLAALSMPPAMQEIYTTQLEINKSVNDYYDRLIKAGVGIDEATSKTQRYAQALTALKEKQLELKNFPTVFKTLSDVFASGLDDAVDQFVEGIKNGTDMAEVFRNVWISVLGDIMKEFLKLAITHPLENALFGTNLPVIGGVGGASAGGLLGGLFGGKSTFTNPFQLPSLTVPTPTTASTNLPFTGSPSLQPFGASAPFDTFGMPTGTAVTGSLSSAGWMSSLQNMQSATTSAVNSVTSSVATSVTGMTSDIGSTISNQFEAARNSIRMIESGSFGGDYGLVSKSGALGAYQVMPNNVVPWTQKYFGQALTPNQFLNNPAAQDAVFNGQFGMYANKYGYTGAAQAWFAGEKGMKNLGGTDMFGTSVGGYGSSFNNYFSSPSNPANSLGGLDKATQNLQKDFSDFGDKIPNVTDQVDTAFTKIDSSATQLADGGIKQTETAMSQYADSTLSNAATQQAATTASTTTMGTSAITTSAEVQTLGTASQTASAQMTAGGLGGAGGGLGGLFGSLFAAKGLASSGPIIRFGTGGIVRTPSMFALGGGTTGQMGEAGAEAIMPLVRDGAGRLSVRSVGGHDSGGSDDIVSAIQELKSAFENRPAPTTKVVNAFDGPSFLNEALSTRDGEVALLNHVRSRKNSFRQALGI